MADIAEWASEKGIGFDEPVEPEVVMEFMEKFVLESCHCAFTMALGNQAGVEQEVLSEFASDIMSHGDISTVSEMTRMYLVLLSKNFKKTHNLKKGDVINLDFIDKHEPRWERRAPLAWALSCPLKDVKQYAVKIWSRPRVTVEDKVGFAITMAVMSCEG